MGDLVCLGNGFTSTEETHALIGLTKQFTFALKADYKLLAKTTVLVVFLIV